MSTELLTNSITSHYTTMFQFATINVVSVLGNEQNVTKNIKRWPVDASNVRQLNVNAKHHDEQHPDMALTRRYSIELHENGEDAVSLIQRAFGMP
jgi:hypothetical protein